LIDAGGAEGGTEAAEESPGLTERIAEREPCDYCGAVALEWRKCKLVCTNCHQINKSCADL
jgi:hypothetical protein